ncbi:MAG: LCP family protein [Actinomycetota bacterium]|nr:LCP family protein [Actinomycetota bacterium]
MKKILLIVLIVIIVAALAYLSFFLINKYRNEDVKIADTSTSVMLEDSTSTSLSVTTTTIDKSLYFSKSENFTDYFLKIPEGWSVYEKDGGERLVLNSNESNESIIIDITNVDDSGDLSESEMFADKYLEGLNDFDNSIEMDVRDVKISGINAEILGYEYSIEPEDNKSFTDMITSFVYEDALYVMKYIGADIETEKASLFFSQFLADFHLGAENNLKGIEDEKYNSINLLILGDDSAFDRPGGRVNGRTDIIMILHLNLESGEGTIVTIPRDTWVDIPGHGEGKINGAHAMGGNELTIETIEKFSGLEIDNYIITDFDGFKPLIDFFGGVTVEVNEDLADGFSGCYLSKGIHHLNGEQALALARNRHRSGEPGQQGGAFAREREAAKIIIALMRQQSDLEKFIKMPFFIKYLTRYVWTDIEFKDITKYLFVFGKINYSKIDITTIPSWPEMVGNASAVVYDKQATKELFETIKEQ